MSDQEAEVIAAYNRLRDEVVKLQEMEEDNRRLAEGLYRHLGIPLPDEPQGRHLKAIGLMIPVPLVVQKLIASGTSHAIGLGAAGVATATLVVGGAYAATGLHANPYRPRPAGIGSISIAPGASFPLVPSIRDTPGRSAAPVKARQPSSTPRASVTPAPTPRPRSASPPASPGPPSFSQAPTATPTVAQGPPGGSSPGSGPISVPPPPSSTPSPTPQGSPPSSQPSSPPSLSPQTSPSSLPAGTCLSVVVITACIA